MKTFRTTLADAHEEINALRAQLAAVTAELAAIKALTPDSPFSGGVTVQQLWAGFRGADGALADAGTVATPTTPLDVETGIRALTAERDAARAECERLRKLFDDAGAGEHNVLALIDHYQDEALKATSELVQARQLVALLEDRISDVEDRDDARTVCEWAATVALKSTDVHNAATRYLTGVQSPLRTRLAEVERERDADMRNVERALALADRLRSERDALAAEKALLTRRLKSYSQGTTRGEILDGTPDGTEIAYYRDGVFTRIGTPTSDDESHNCDAMGCGQNHVVQRVNVAALEATAEDARTCAEYCVKWDPVGVSSRAGYRVLGQLPPRPVAELDLDDVRVCAANVADNYSSTCPPGSNAARILAALGAK